MINDKYGYGVDGAGGLMISIEQIGLLIAAGAIFFALLIYFNTKKQKAE